METPKCRCGKSSDRKISFEPDIGFVHFCSNECKDGFISEMEIMENNEYRQGRSRTSYETSMKAFTFTVIILAIVVIFALISYVMMIISKQLI
jgi:hypothetical protein